MLKELTATHLNTTGLVHKAIQLLYIFNQSYTKTEHTIIYLVYY